MEIVCIVTNMPKVKNNIPSLQKQIILSANKNKIHKSYMDKCKSHHPVAMTSKHI